MGEDEEEIQRELDEGLAAGQLEVTPDGKFRLTEMGEAASVDGMGGRDVVNVTTALIAGIAKAGLLIADPKELGRDIETDIYSWFLVQRVVFSFAHTFRETPLWRPFVERLEADYLEPRGYFERGMNRAFLNIPDGPTEGK